MARKRDFVTWQSTRKVFGKEVLFHGLIWIYGFLLFSDSVLCQSSSSEFRFAVEPEDIVAVKEEPLLLNCSAQYMQQIPHMEWMRDQVRLNFQGETRRHKLPNGSLLFDSIIHTRSHRPDEGIYQCVATVTDLGTIVSRKAKLQIAYLSRNFEKEPQSLAVHLGNLAVFECNMKGAPIPVVHWYKDDLEIDTNSVNYHLHLDGTLEISQVQFADFGRYKCKVENVGEKSAFSEEALLTQNSDISTYQGVAPHFILTPDDKVALEGTTVEFHCAANGRDKDAIPPTITWLKQGVTIDMADLDSRFSQMGQGSLRIMNVLEEDQGMYTCRATNSEDSVDCEARLTVHVAPRFQRRPSNVFAQLHTDVEFHCDVFGVPEPEIQWMKNGNTIINSQYFQISDGGRSLQILGLVETDRGVYQCFAENEVGNIQASAQLDIENSGDADSPEDKDNAQLASEPTSIAVPFVSTQFATLTWKPPNQIGTSQILNYTVFWKEDGSERNRMMNTSALEANIEGLEPSTKYNVRVMAVNRAGAGRAASVDILTKDEVNVPGPPRNLKAETVSSMAIYVKWDPPSSNNGAISKYHVIYYKDGEKTEHTQEVNEAEYIFEELEEFTNYNFYVVAYNQNGASSPTEEVMARTYSAVPTAPPQNFTLEVLSSTTIVLRWEPPPKEAQNGIITGYKIRFKKEGNKKGSTVTEDANQRSHSLTDLERGAEYLVRIAALNVNGSGVPTEWQSANTYQYDLDETMVPGQPASLTTRPQTNSIMVGWIPPPERDIRIRGYILGYGKGFPDVYKLWLDHDQRFHTIKNLEPGTKYVISIKAWNHVGEGRPRLEEESTRSDVTDEEVSTPMIPPVGLKARVLSSTTILLTWTDTTLSKNQRVTDQRYYTVRYTPTSGPNSNKYRYLNSTTVNAHIEGLRPNTEHDFSVKVIKGRRKSTWSLSAFNTTFESAPASAPRDLTPVGVPKNPTAVTLSWQPPRQANGLITGYVVLYTTDGTQRDREWVVDGVVGGERLSTTIRDLTPETTYFFKVQARNSQGMGPVSPTVVYRTPDSDGSGGGRLKIPDDYNRPTKSYPKSGDTSPKFDVNKFLEEEEKRKKEATSPKKNGFPPLILYISIACVAGVTVIAVVVVAFIMCKRRNTNNRKGNYTQANVKPNTNVLKPPDLWIHHEQVELKSIDKNNPDAMQVPEEMKPLNTDYSGDRSYDSRDNERYHRTPVRSKPIMISVEQPPPPREPIATAIPNGQLMLSEGEEEDDHHSGVGGHSTPIRPAYPRTQYTHYTSTPRVNAGDFSQPSSGTQSPLESPAYSNQHIPIPYDQLHQYHTHHMPPPTQSPSPQPPTIQQQMGGGTVPPPQSPTDSNKTLSMPRTGNPLKSFAVPGPPGAIINSQPPNNLPKHIVKPQPANTPYKKPNPPVSGSSGNRKDQLDTSLRSDTDSDIPEYFRSRSVLKN